VHLRIEYQPQLPLEFGHLIGRRFPSFSSLALSSFLHGFAVAALALVSFPPPPVPPQAEHLPVIHPTEIRIDNRLYYVSRISNTPVPRKNPVPPKPDPAQKSPAPTPKPKTMTAPAPAPVLAAARAFIPPELRQRQLPTDQTLIQPLSPPDLIPPDVQLPSMRIWTAQAPKIPKPFVAPGRKTPEPPQQARVLPTPDFDLVHAAPVPSNLNPRLALPPAPPPVIDMAPPKIDSVQVVPAAPLGDAVNILSLNNNAIPMPQKLVVPAGNLVGKSGESPTAVTSTSETPDPPKAPPSVSATVPGKTSTTTAAVSSPSPAGSPAPSAAKGKPAASVFPPAAVGSGRPSDGTASAGAGGRTGTGPQLIIRPANGRFDAVVVQSSPLDQFPESKELLTGRPIYTVYVSLNSAKDWALYFCVPNEKPPQQAGGFVVEIGTSAPVQAPYPTRLVRPDIVVPSYQKYILVHGFINPAGRFEGLKVVRSVQPETDAALVAELAGWEFRAATRDGVKIGVEFLLSIPVAGM
jgi:hypothetical protein